MMKKFICFYFCILIAVVLTPMTVLAHEQPCGQPDYELQVALEDAQVVLATFDQALIDQQAHIDTFWTMVDAVPEISPNLYTSVDAMIEDVVSVLAPETPEETLIAELIANYAANAATLTNPQATFMADQRLWGYLNDLEAELNDTQSARDLAYYRAKRLEARLHIDCILFRFAELS